MLPVREVTWELRIGYLLNLATWWGVGAVTGSLLGADLEEIWVFHSFLQEKV